MWTLSLRPMSCGERGSVRPVNTSSPSLERDREKELFYCSIRSVLSIMQAIILLMEGLTHSYGANEGADLAAVQQLSGEKASNHRCNCGVHLTPGSGFSGLSGVTSTPG